MSRQLPRPGLIATAAILVVGGTAAAVLLSSPSYPHSWCGPVIGEMHSRSGTEGGYEAAMARYQRQDHAPVGKLLSDLYAYDAADDAAENGSNFSALGNLASATSALDAVSADLQVINRECGQPRDAYKHDTL